MPRSLFRLSYPEVCDNEIIRKLLDNNEAYGYMSFELSDGIIEDIPIKEFIYNRIFWQMLLDFNKNIKVQHFRIDKTVSAHTIADLLTIMYDEVMSDVDYLDYDKWIDLKERVEYEGLWKVIDNLHKFSIIECAEYHASMNILDLAEFITLPEIKDIKKGINFDTTLGMAAVEKSLDNANKKLLIEIEKERSKNKLKPFYDAGLLNRFQIPQMILAFGPRTDIDDSVISIPVKSSAIEGLQTIEEYLIESKSACKSAAYNHSSISEAQYFQRKLHLLTSTVHKLYAGDCGSNIVINFEVDAVNHKHLEGKIGVNPDGSMYPITSDMTSTLIGKTIKIRSALGCRHTDGACQICAGLLSKQFPRGIHIGILNAIKIAGPVTQGLLSAKHMVKTRSIEYNVTPQMGKYFFKKGTDIHFNEDVETAIKDWFIGIPIECISSINDLALVNKSDPVEERISSVSSIIFKDKEGNIVDEIDVSNDSQDPVFAMQMLMHMKHNIKKISNDDTHYWVPISGFNFTHAVFKTAVLNDSMMAFVKTVKDFLSKESDKKYTSINGNNSISQALQSFSRIVYSQVSTNILHLEILLRAFLITNKDNYAIPIVEDPENVQFETMSRVITNRTLGGKFAFEGLMSYLSNPQTYIKPKGKSPFDIFFGIVDPNQEIDEQTHSEIKEEIHEYTKEKLSEEDREGLFQITDAYEEEDQM